MMKFFRKYNKYLLVVFMSLLVMVWVGGSALEAWLIPTPGADVIARAFGREIQGFDRALAAEETRILDVIGLFHWRTLGLGNQELQPLDWYLLRREAERMGILIPPEQIDNFIFKRLQMTNESLAQIRQSQSRGVSIEQIRAAVAGYLTVQEAARTAATSVVHVTEARVKHMARDTLEKIRMEFVVLSATSFRDNNETLDEADLARHFETYKDVALRSQGGLGFGYQVPTQVRVEYVEADLAKIKSTISVTDEEIERYYEEHKAEFVKPVAPTPPPAPTPTITPTITPAPTTQPTGVRRRRRTTTQPATAPTPAVDPTATPTSTPESDEAPQAATPAPQNTGTVVKAEIVFAQDGGEAAPQETPPAATAVPSTADTPAATTTPPGTTITIAPQPGLTVTSTPPAVPPAAPAASPTPTIEYLPLSEVRDQILDKIRTPLAAEKAEAFMKGVLSDLAGFWDGAERDKERFRIAPSAEIAEPGHFQNVLNKRQRRGWRVAEACSVQTSKLFNATLSGATQVLALRVTNPANPRVRTGGFNRLVLLVKGVGTFPAEDSTEDTSTYIAVNQTCPILLKSSNSGNFYLFRVTKVVPAHAPEDLETARARVESDFRTAKSFTLVEQEARRIAEIARREGIEAARNALTEDVQARVQVVRPEPFSRLRQRSMSFGGTSPRFLESPSRVDRIFGTQESTREFIDACFELGQAAPNPPTDHRVAVIPRPGQRQVVVVEWIETLGVRRDEYKTERDQLVRSLAYLDQQEIMKKWFGLEEIHKRVGFELVDVTESDDENVEP